MCLVVLGILASVFLTSTRAKWQKHLPLAENKILKAAKAPQRSLAFTKLRVESATFFPEPVLRLMVVDVG